MGGDHRGADGDHRVLRAERVLPRLETVGGFVTSTAIIVVLVLVLYWMFKRRDWL